MWIIASFDLPTLTKKDRRYANNFRKDLLKLGFTKLQLSVYSYYASSKEKAEQIAQAGFDFTNRVYDWGRATERLEEAMVTVVRLSHRSSLK